MEWTFEDKSVELIMGDLVECDVDAIVNAANTSLTLGGGVAGAIRAKGGPSIQKECNKHGSIGVGEAVLTRGGNLKARYVIHAAGPVYGEGDEDKKLAQATINSLTIAEKHKMNRIAFPAISTGIFHFPMKRCSKIMLTEAMEFLKKNDYPEKVIFCLYGSHAYETFKETLEELKHPAL